MNDPLNINIPMAGVETSLPLLPEADYRVQVVESTIDPNKEKTGHNWNIKVVTTDPATSADGREIKPNHPLYIVCALQARDESKDREAYMRGLGDYMDAIFGTTKEDRPNFTRQLASEAIGKSCLATVFIDNWLGKDHNKVRRLKKVAG